MAGRVSENALPWTVRGRATEIAVRSGERQRWTYATAYSSFVENTAIFSNAEAKYDCARVWIVSTRRTFIFVFLHGFLAVPSTRQNLESAPLFFCLGGVLSN